jgi:hypothetical protein
MCVFTKDYEENANMGYEKTKPKQSQSNPISKSQIGFGL